MLQSHRDSNFCPHMFAQVLKQLNIRHNLSTVYHPESQGALEHFHQVFKGLLCAYCTELGVDWEGSLPWLMLASREAMQESEGFSPNEFLEHTGRGPLDALPGEWVDGQPSQKLIDFVNEFRHRLSQDASRFCSDTVNVIKPDSFPSPRILLQSYTLDIRHVKGTGHGG